MEFRREARGIVALFIIGMLPVVALGCAVSPRASQSLTASPSPQLRQDAGFSSSATVPAGGSVDVPLTFEGASSAEVVVYVSNVANVTGTIGGVTLTSSTSAIMPALSASITAPVDGPLHLSNAGTADASIGVMVLIPTSRHVSITASPRTASVGSVVSVDVTLSDAGANETVEVVATTPGGARISVPVTSTGQGTWHGQLTISERGQTIVLAHVSGSRPRNGSATITAPMGGVTFGGSFAERLDDPDGDGLANALVVSPTISVQRAGTYLVNGTLLDSAGQTVATATGTVSLDSAGTSFDLSFDGETIYKSARSGPYHLARVNVLDATTSTEEAAAEDLGTTQGYAYTAFQHRH